MDKKKMMHFIVSVASVGLIQQHDVVNLSR